jgi:hypothetical protein
MPGTEWGPEYTRITSTDHGTEDVTQWYLLNKQEVLHSIPNTLPTHTHPKKGTSPNLRELLEKKQFLYTIIGRRNLCEKCSKGTQEG